MGMWTQTLVFGWSFVFPKIERLQPVAPTKLGNCNWWSGCNWSSPGLFPVLSTGLQIPNDDDDDAVADDDDDDAVADDDNDDAVADNDDSGNTQCHSHPLSNATEDRRHDDNNDNAVADDDDSGNTHTLFQMKQKTDSP